MIALSEICNTVTSDPLSARWPVPDEQLRTILRDYLSEACASDGQLSRMASLSYAHPLGYTKIISSTEKRETAHACTYGPRRPLIRRTRTTFMTTIGIFAPRYSLVN